MKALSRRRVAVGLVASVLVLSIVPPAFGGPSVASIGRQVQALTKRVNALAALHLLNNDVATSEQTGVMLSIGNGYYRGTANCGILGTATGGGVTFDVSVDASDNLIESGPAGNGWRATVYSPQRNRSTVRVICTDLE